MENEYDIYYYIDKYKDTNKINISPYDKRNYKFKDLVPVGALRIPDNYESPKTPFIFDQGDSCMCAACSVSTIRYLQESDRKSGGSGIDEAFSPAYIYANRNADEEFEGMYLRTAASKAREGQIPYSIFPGFYTYAQCKKLYMTNKDKWSVMAKPFAVNSYYQCTSREQVQTAIMTTKAVLVGVMVYRCFYFPDENNQIEYDLSMSTKNYGGHAITIVGWKTIGDKLYWIIQNSWGDQWGDNGRALLSEEYPWLESPYALVDNNIETDWKQYKATYMK